jgi:NADP-dependent 3-hydroxy acid dehydrogenase YdfG
MNMSVKREAPVAVVTGAESGIGKATALEFAKAGHKMSLVDCNEERLKKIISKYFSPTGGDHVY